MSSREWQFEVKQFVLPKSGAELSECEDAIGINLEALRFAIADGATEAFDARNWAARLAERWVRDEPTALSVETFSAWVAEQGKWLQSNWEGRALSWYAEEKARAGSFAAFAGVQLEIDASGARWHAIALGDSCLIQLRAGALCRAWPLSDYQSFTATPLLVPSKGALASALAQAATATGSIERGDRLLLLSDAAAAWYLKLLAGKEPVREQFDFLLASTENTTLARLFDDERRAGRIKDDDVAVVHITVA